MGRSIIEIMIKINCLERPELACKRRRRKHTETQIYIGSILISAEARCLRERVGKWRARNGISKSVISWSLLNMQVETILTYILKLVLYSK